MNKSESIASLADALSKAQSTFLPVKRTEQVSYQTTRGLKKYKYAPLPNVLESIHKALADNGLAISQVPKIEGDKVVIETAIIHSSGEWLSGDMVVCNDNLPPQEKGSALTYTRRYALSSILGLAADEDDDAEIATVQATKPEVKAPVKLVSPTVETSPSDMGVGGITPPQTKKIHATAKEKGLPPEEARAYMQKTFNKSSTKELTKDEASAMIAFLEEIVAGEPPLVRAAKHLECKSLASTRK
jgi:hypothetical protein